MKNKWVLSAVVALCASCVAVAEEEKLNISGIYPELAYYNQEGECGTGAVVPWAGKLWVITYAPHRPFGSSDKLYEISPELEMNIRPESVGGTPANRMIHRETNQLFIGPYLIDAQGKVRVLPPESVPGRHTGVARHTSDPTNKMFLATMEEGFYEIDMNTLEAKTLFTDGNVLQKGKKLRNSQNNPLLPGAHGKGLYSGQNVLVYSNNGETSKEAMKKFDVKAGVLAEYDGKEWKVVRRNQFTEVTGPGGIYGNTDPANDPIWAVGWDHRSLLLGVREPQKGWSFFRLPKASNTYDGAHGWNTEWPRIRDIGPDGKPELLMTMHGMFWSFPKTFSSENSTGIRPLSNYLKVIGDFSRWNDRIVLGCDDSAQKEFLNKRACKGKISGAGQSNSNLWFVDPAMLGSFGPAYGAGYLYKQEKVAPGSVSDPYLFVGWANRNAWIANHGKTPVTLTFETGDGRGNWKPLPPLTVAGGESSAIPFDAATPGEWIRVKNDNTAELSVAMNYAPQDSRTAAADPIFNGLATAADSGGTTGLLYARGGDRRSLVMSDNKRSYEFNARLAAQLYQDRKLKNLVRKGMEIPVFTSTERPVEMMSHAVAINDGKGRRYLLPVSNPAVLPQQEKGQARLCREVATERDLFNCAGTFYELPAENADGFAKIRPIASHPFAIGDYASYRGLLVMNGVKAEAAADGKHLFGTPDGKALIWAGAFDDLWKLGKPVGKGGPWNSVAAEADKASDPYLFGGYDIRELALSHGGKEPVTFTVEIDPAGDGVWFNYRKFEVAPEKTVTHLFPQNIQGRWIRFRTDKPCSATAQLEYR